ncbi:MAG: hypothetical protein HKM02_07725 [Pseudomonadales bacterium]|nr:hypothetical protein [Pseudomonadales bacterium]
MAINYYDMTGVLILDQVTPVIKALFNGYNLDGSFPGKGQAYIANISESSNCSWYSVCENLESLAKELGLKIDESNMIEEVLSVLASHFSANQNNDLANLMENSTFEDDASLDALFTIAKAFDDGHGLKAFKYEGCWHCDKPRLDNFGGHGEFTGSHVTVRGSSTGIVELGEKLEAAIESGNTNKAAELICKQVSSLLAGIYDEVVRKEVANNLVQMLSA